MSARVTEHSNWCFFMKRNYPDPEDTYSKAIYTTTTNALFIVVLSNQHVYMSQWGTIQRVLFSSTYVVHTGHMFMRHHPTSPCFSWCVLFSRTNAWTEWRRNVVVPNVRWMYICFIWPALNVDEESAATSPQRIFSHMPPKTQVN